MPRESIRNRTSYNDHTMDRRNFETEIPTKSPRKYKIFGNFDNKSRNKSPSMLTPPKYGERSQIYKQY